MKQEVNADRGHTPSFFAGHPIRTTVVVVLIVALPLWALHVVSGSRAISAKHEAIREAGFPVNLVELNSWYVVPPAGENAAHVVLEAVDAYVSPEDAGTPGLPIVGEGELPPIGSPLPEAWVQAIPKYLALNKDCLRLLYQAAEMPRSRYPLDLTTGPAQDIAHLGSCRQVVRLLNLESVAHAEAGDADRAVRALVVSFTIGQSLREEPLLISQLVTVACLGVNLEALEFVVSRAPLNPAQLEAIESELAGIDLGRSFGRAFAGERCFLFESEQSSFPAAALGLGQKDRLFMLGAYEQLIEAVNLPPFQAREVGVRLTEELGAGAPRVGVSHILLPAMVRALETPMRAEARRKVALAALAVERFHLAQGALPQSLQELASTGITVDITDPCDGNPLTYVANGSEFMVYSIGSDQMDDGGTPGSRSSGDIVFTVRRALSNS